MADLEEELISENHSKLLRAIQKLDKTQHITPPTRTEASNKLSEFNLTKTHKTNIEDVLSVLKKSIHNAKLSKKIMSAQDQNRTLPKPLEKVQREKIKRTTAFEESKEKLGKWDAIVTRNRVMDSVSFPLQKPIHKMENTNDFLNKMKLKSDLETELDALEPKESSDKESEDEGFYQMTLEEMKEHRSLLARIRAKESFKAAKAKRQGKIKSKQYHRYLRKEKLKQQFKEFEDLQITNPEEALKKLEELEKNRAKERHTLRHKNTSKWAKNLQVKAKYDKEARQQLAEQLTISKNLTQKVDINEDSGESSDEDQEEQLVEDSMNPWLMTNKNNQTDTDVYKPLPQVLNKEESSSDDEEINTQIEAMKKENEIQLNSIIKLNSRNNKVQSTTEWTVEEFSVVDESLPDILDKFENLEKSLEENVKERANRIRRELESLNNHNEIKDVEKSEENNEFDLSFKKQSKRPVIDTPLDENADVNPSEESNNLATPVPLRAPTAQQSENIDPSKFIEAKPKYLITALSEGVNGMDDLDDEEESRLRADISEVFEEDDVVANFRQEKAEEIEKDQITEVQKELPGWGSWAGSGIKAQPKRRNRFITKKTVQQMRRDENKGDVIIKEFNKRKVTEHKVKELPFPFTSIKDFEASIRAPLGNSFIPEKAHKKAIRPSVFTTLGTIIEPMTDNDLIIKNKKRKLKL